MLYNRVNQDDNEISATDKTRHYLSPETDSVASAAVSEKKDQQEYRPNMTASNNTKQPADHLQDQNERMLSDDDQYLDPIISDQLSKDEVEFYTLIPALQLFLSKEIDFGVNDNSSEEEQREEAQEALILCIAYLIFQELSTSDAFDMPQYTTHDQKQVVIQHRRRVVSEAIQKYCDQMVANHVQFWENYEPVFEAYEQITYFLRQELQR